MKKLFLLTLLVGAFASPVLALQQGSSTNIPGQITQEKFYPVKIVALPSKDNWDRAAFVINTILACIGIVGATVAIRTLNAIKRQADIQTAALRQWMDVELVGSDTGETLLDAFGDIPQTLQIGLHFKAVNSTSYPLTVKSAIVQISRNKHDGKMQWECFKCSEVTILPPNRNGRESTYRFFVFLNLEGPAVKSYIDDNFWASINGKVFFEPVTGGKIEEQWFGFMSKCGPNIVKPPKTYMAREAIPINYEEYESYDLS